MKGWMWTVLAVGLGAVAGFLYWHFVGCDHGCAITSVWWRSTAYGAILGYLTLGLLRPTPAAQQK